VGVDRDMAAAGVGSFIGTAIRLNSRRPREEHVPQFLELVSQDANLLAYHQSNTVKIGPGHPAHISSIERRKTGHQLSLVKKFEQSNDVLAVQSPFIC